VVKYKYLGEFESKDIFFTKGNTYKVISEGKRGSVELEDDEFSEYGMGVEISKYELNSYFEEV